MAGGTDGAALELQGLLYTQFSASAAVKALIGDPARVYDRIPPDALFPYVVIGESQEVADLVECYAGSEHFPTVHIWTRDQAGQGKVAGKRIGHALMAVLAEIEASGTSLPHYEIHNIEWQDIRFFDDPDGLSVHGVMTLRVVTQATD